MICQLEEAPGYGRCCCNCCWQMVAVCHPWNKTFAKGRTTEILGYLCAEPDFSTHNAIGVKSAVFFDDAHGMCEMHGFKKIKQEI